MIFFHFTFFLRGIILRHNITSNVMGGSAFEALGMLKQEKGEKRERSELSSEHFMYMVKRVSYYWVQKTEGGSAMMSTIDKTRNASS